MTDMPHASFINLVDPPAKVHFDANGEAKVSLPGAIGNIDVREFRRVSFMIGQTKAHAVQALFGTLDGPTLAEAFIYPNDLKIKTHKVVAPLFGLQLVQGPPNTDEEVQVWVFLQS